MPPQMKKPVVVIACKVLQNVLEQLLPGDLAPVRIFLDYGLHDVPDDLTSTVQSAMDRIEEPSLVMLGYGLCGNGLQGIRSGDHTLVIPRTDDCIALLLGSYQAYLQEFRSVPGTYYLTKGWLESGSDPLKESTTSTSRSTVPRRRCGSWTCSTRTTSGCRWSPAVRTSWRSIGPKTREGRRLL